jgi:hypothetical protein
LDLSWVRKAVNAESYGSMPMNISPTPTCGKVKELRLVSPARLLTFG